MVHRGEDRLENQYIVFITSVEVVTRCLYGIYSVYRGESVYSVYIMCIVCIGGRVCLLNIVHEAYIVCIVYDCMYL